jgi:hypothetical protein
MKCQSDFSVEADTLLNQADECMEEWWEGERRQAKEASKRVWEEDDPALIVKREVRKRGLVEENTATGA